MRGDLGCSRADQANAVGGQPLGSDPSAGNDLLLRADNRIDLLTAQDLEVQRSQSCNSSAAIGIAAAFSSLSIRPCGVSVLKYRLMSANGSRHFPFA